MQKNIILIFCLFIHICLSASVDREDNKSIEQKLKSVSPTEKVKLLNELSKKVSKKNPDKSLSYAQQALQLAKKMNDKISESTALFNIGFAYKQLNDYENAMEYFQQSYDLSKSIGLKEAMGTALNNIASIYLERSSFEIANKYYMEALNLRTELVRENPDSSNYQKQLAKTIFQQGNVYYYWGKLETAFNKYQEALKLFEKINFSEGIALCLNNQGNIYLQLKKFDNALECYTKSMKLQLSLDNKMAIADNLNNIGNIYSEKGDQEKALKNYMQSLAIKEQEGNDNELPDALNSIGNFFHKKRKFEQAKVYYQKALDINLKFEMKEGIALSYNALGELLIDQNKIQEGIEFCNKSLNIAREINASELKMNNFMILSQAYEKLNNSLKALEYFKLFTDTKEKLYANESSEKILEMESRYKLEKKEAERKQKEELIQKEISRRNNIQYSLIFIILVGLFLSVFFSGRFVLPKWFAEAIVFFTVVMLFEFLLVILDPTIEKYAQGMPALKLASNITMAVLIFPIHSLLEENLKKRAMKKIHASSK